MRRRKAPRPTDGTMSLMEHLYELRHRLFLAVLAIFLGSVVGFIWYTVGIPAIGLKSLGDILIHPYCAVPPTHRLPLGGDPNTCALLATTPFSQLTVRLQAGVMAGAVLSSPAWLYQLWSFVTPALYRKERRFAISFVVSAAILFMGGTVIAYFVIGKALDVLLGFGGNTAVSALTPEAYFSFLLGMLLIFGVSLELPLLLVMLNYAGVVKGVKLAKARRYAFFGLVVFAAFVVPGNDPISMSALAVVLIVLYEVAVQVAKAHDRRKAKEAEQTSFASLPDDVASPLPVTGTRAEASDSVGTPEPVPAAEPDTASEPSGAGGSRADRWADSGDAT
jgi:sec-independent protein translocase protein TatC